MSNLTVKGNTSGTGTVILEAPNTNSNRTITLPDSTSTLATTADLSTINTALEFISSATINNVATVDFTGFDSSKYSDYVFSLDNVIPVTDASFLFMRMSTDGGSTYITTNGYFYQEISNWYNGTSMTLTSSSSSGLFNAVFLNQTRSIGSDTNEFGISGELKVFGTDLSARTYVTFSGAFIDAGGFFVTQFATGSNQTTTAVNAVRFGFGSGNLESGRITMYGVRKS